MTRQLVYVDTETTGLSDHAVPWEIAWAVEDGDIHVETLPVTGHDLMHADPVGMALNGFYDRYPHDLNYGVLDIGMKRATLAGALNGNTLVACNPAFDARMLSKFLGCEPWHYRMLDVETYAMAKLDLDHVPSLKEITDLLAERLELTLPQPDHTASGDVAATRTAFLHLRTYL